MMRGQTLRSFLGARFISPQGSVFLQSGSDDVDGFRARVIFFKKVELYIMLSGSADKNY